MNALAADTVVHDDSPRRADSDDWRASGRLSRPTRVRSPSRREIVRWCPLDDGFSITPRQPNILGITERNIYLPA